MGLHALIFVAPNFLDLLYHASEAEIVARACMTRFLSQPETDFLQDRISGSMFMRNYFNPALISDLKERVFKAIEELRLLS